jgi:hypothetical protein
MKLSRYKPFVRYSETVVTLTAYPTTLQTQAKRVASASSVRREPAVIY